jgi:hypothetical protein
MKKSQKLEIQKEILKLEKPYPSDNFIESYPDFLKHRDYLAYYQFNSVVFHKLLLLIISLWETKNRISRISLLLFTKNYLNNAYDTTPSSKKYEEKLKPGIELSLEIRKLIFKVLKLCIENNKYLIENQRESAEWHANSMLIHIALTEEEEVWMCNNFSKYQTILNRILKYPVASDTLYNWALQNYDNKELISRKAEIAALILNKNPEFEIKIQTIIEDYQYQKKLDQENYQKFLEGLEVINFIYKELGVLTFRNEIDGQIDRPFLNDEIDDTQPKTFQYSKRSYKVPIDMEIFNEYHFYFPNFKLLEEDFDNNINLWHCKSMIWAITFSKLDKKLKTQKIQKYYNEKTHKTVLLACKRDKNLDLYKWLLTQA